MSEDPRVDKLMTKGLKVQNISTKLRSYVVLKKLHINNPATRSIIMKRIFPNNGCRRMLGVIRYASRGVYL